jgi:hypothetical protein
LASAIVPKLLGDTFELRFETRTTTLRMPNGESVWELFVSGYAQPTPWLPVSERRDQLKQETMDARQHQYRLPQRSSCCGCRARSTEVFRDDDLEIRLCRIR